MTLLFECAARAALIATGTALTLWVMRVRTASTRHAAWTAVVIAMLLLPIWSAAGPKVPLRVLRRAPSLATVASVPAAPTPAVARADAAAPAVPSGGELRPGLDWQRALLGVYLVGVVALLARLLVGTVHANRLRRRAVIEHGCATSDLCATPITVGWFAPVLILPSGWRQWPEPKLAAVLTHERAHAHRRDPLVQWVALFNRAVFWFHPLAWWLERRLATLAEEACDAAVLAAGHAPQDYSQYLLDLARSMTQRGRRLHVVGTAMPGSGLTPRLHRILDGAPAPQMSRARITCAFALCAISSAVFAAGTLAPAQQGATRQAFDVASIKPSSDKASTTTRVTPSGISYTGLTARMLIADAYGVKALSMSSPDPQARSVLDDRQRYDIEAKADHPVSRPQLQLMLQTLLADRFKLTLRHESKIESVYRLVSLPSGAKLQESVGDGDPACGPAPDGGAVCRHMTMAAFAEVLTSHLSRVVLDETKLTGHYDFTLKLDGTPGLNQMRDMISGSADPGAAKAAWAAAMNDWSGSSILADIQKQLGLKLEADKAPVDSLVIVHLERPSSQATR